MDQRDDDLICVGHILGAQGIKGWVRVFSRTSPRQNILNYSPWLLGCDGGLQEKAVTGRLQGRNLVARIDGIEDRNGAEALTGVQLFIRPGQLPRLEAGEYYWSDLIGLRVETQQAEPLGVVDSMLETGADDVMVLKGERERLIPFVVPDIVTEVDLANQRVVVNWSPEY